MRVAVIHGPNLNLLGRRQPEIYGTATLADLEKRIEDWAGRLEISPSFYQSNDESEIVDLIQNSGFSQDAIVLNVGGFTHTSVAIADAVASTDIPTVEVHISDINAREPFRRTSLVKPFAVRQISGRGQSGYRDALRHLINRTKMPFSEVRYGPHPDNIADVWDPGQDRLGQVILVHGGFWLDPYQRDTMESLSVALALNGYRTINIEYRRSGRWPDSGQDLATAFQSFSDQPTAVIGHSAGGYLALWLGCRAEIDLTIGLAAISDLEIAKADRPSVEELIGTGAPVRVPATGKTVLIHGAEDDLVPQQHSTRLNESADVEVLPGLGHFDLLRPSDRHWDLINQSLSGMRHR